MDFDLQRGLRDLGADPAVRGTVLPVDTLLRRAHRRRAVRATTYSAVGTGAAAALVVGGVTLADARPPVHEPAPAAPTRTATATPRPTPTPTPTATPTPPPPPAFQPAWDLCGTEVPFALSPDIVPDEWASLTGNGPDFLVTAEVGAPLTAQIEVWSALEPGPTALTATVGRGVLARVDSDGFTREVVGVAAAPVALSGHGEASGVDGFALGTYETGFAACDSSPANGGDGTGHLPEGHYMLIVELALGHDDGTSVSSSAWGTVVIGDPDDTDDTATPPPAPPAPVTGDPSTLAPVGYGVGSIGVPACGATWFSSVPASTWWSVGGSVAHTGATVEVDVTSTGTGLDIPQGAAFEPLVTITRDGVVVAQTPDEARTPFALVNWTTGSTVTRHASLPAVACTTVAGVAAGAPLPSGTYQVWAIQGVRRDLSASSGVNMMYGGPWTLTVP